MYKPILVLLGIVCVVLGVVGIFLPLLPTTPFLLLAATFFAKSSDRLYNKLLNNKYLGSYIKDFKENRTLTIRTKVVSIGLMWAAMLYVIFYVLKLLVIKILLLVVAFCVTIYILSFKTKKNNTSI